MPRSVALEFRDVTKRVPDGLTRRTVLEGVSFQLSSGEFAAIRGPSGSGKTTLLALAGSLASPTSGEVLVRGEPTSRLRDRARAELRRSHVGFVFQDLQLLDDLEALENVLVPLTPQGIAPRDRARAEELLKRFSVEKLARTKVLRLSGGERQRVAMARALIGGPSLLLMDEPTAHLDLEHATTLLQVLRELAAEGKTILVASHDERALQAADVCFTLEGGKLTRPSASLGVS